MSTMHICLLWLQRTLCPGLGRCSRSFFFLHLPIVNAHRTAYPHLLPGWLWPLGHNMGLATTILKCLLLTAASQKGILFKGILKGWFFNGVLASLNSPGASVLKLLIFLIIKVMHGYCEHVGTLQKCVTCRVRAPVLQRRPLPRFGVDSPDLGASWHLSPVHSSSSIGSFRPSPFPPELQPLLVFLLQRGATPGSGPKSLF